MTYRNVYTGLVLHSCLCSIETLESPGRNGEEDKSDAKITGRFINEIIRIKSPARNSICAAFGN